jgi:hypothetical protein
MSPCKVTLEGIASVITPNLIEESIREGAVESSPSQAC